MAVLSIRELNANLSGVLSRVEAGEVITLTKRGRRFARIEPEPENWLDDPVRRAAFERAKADLATPVPGLTGRATYEERTGR